MTTLNDTDGGLFESNKLLEFEGSFDDIMNEHTEQTPTKTPNESTNPGPPQLEDIKSIYFPVSDDPASNLNTKTNTNHNHSYIPITSSHPNTHYFNKTSDHIIIENLNIDPNAILQFSQGIAFRDVTRDSHDAYENQCEKVGKQALVNSL